MHLYDVICIHIAFCVEVERENASQLEETPHQIDSIVHIIHFIYLRQTILKKQVVNGVLLGEMMERIPEKRFPCNAKDYKLYEEVGEGVSATVFRALCLPLNEIVAIKVLDLEKCNNDFVSALFNWSPDPIDFFLFNV